jgi:hypothetical protein
MDRPVWRWGVPAAVVVSAVVGCGGDSDHGSEREAIVAALEEQAAAVRDHDAERYCAKTFLSTDLPEPLGERLGLSTTGPHRASDWQSHFEQCAREFGDNGEFDGKPRIKRVLRVVEGGPAFKEAGIAASARARARIAVNYPDPTPDSSYWRTFKLVKFQGDWKVVGEVN